MKSIDSIREKYGGAKYRYNILSTKRSPLEDTWRQCSELTLPYVFPDDDHDENNRLRTPYNSLGPSSVNNLASKLLLALLPASGNFFRLIPFQEVMEELTTEDKQALDKQLSSLERGITTMIDVQAIRVPLFEALKILIITGNVMLYKVKEGGMKVFNPYEYCVSRDYTGNIIEIVIKETISKYALPTELQEEIEANDTTNSKDKGIEEYDIYTCIKREDDNKYYAYQEVNDVVLPNSITTYTTEDMPYMALRWTNTFNESYGRGLVEQYLGDLRSLEGLSKIILDGSGIASKYVFGLKPASSTKLEDINNAKNGDVIMGDLEKDITVLQTNKAADMQVPFQLMQQLELRLNRAFLNVQGGVRDSERTTAVEVRATIAELEATLGGTFSVLAQEFQLPLLTLLLKEANPKAMEITLPSIVTGASAISRERDLQNLTYMVQSLGQLGPDAIARYLKVDGYLRQIATALSIDPDTVVKTQEELQQEQQMAMQQQQMMMRQEQQMKQQG